MKKIIWLFINLYIIFNFCYAESLKLHLKMNETGNNTIIFDHSVYGNNGVAQQQAVNISTSGKVNTALSFNGASDYIDCGDINEVDNIHQFSISGWVYINNLTARSSIIEKSITDTERLIVGLGFIAPYDDVLIYIQNGQSNYAYTSSSILITSIWQFWTVVFNGNATKETDRLKFYLNGELQSLTFFSVTPYQIASVTESIKIGNIGSGLTKFDGRIDDIRIYNVALNESEIDFLYNNGLGNENNLIRYAEREGYKEQRYPVRR